MIKLAYQPQSSLLHKLYPITKLGWLILASVLLFILANGILLGLTAVVFFVFLLVTFPQIWSVRGFRFALSTGIILFILYVLFDKSGQVIFDPGWQQLTVTTGGVTSGLRFSGRFLSIIFLSYLFILSTDPNQLAYAMMQIGLPYRYGFMLVTALRLAPILEQEGHTIYQAQLTRGVRYDRNNLKKLFLLVQQFTTPLLISAIRRADKLVFSMEGRAFGRYPDRTFRKIITPTFLDVTVSILLSIFFAALLSINYGGLI